jgi:hypothetical protein
LTSRACSGRTCGGRTCDGRTCGGRTCGGRTCGGRTCGGRTCGGRCEVRISSRIRLTSLRACGGRCEVRRSSRERRTSLRSYILRSVLPSTVVKYRGLGSKATKAGSTGRPACLLPRPGIKPSWGGKDRTSIIGACGGRYGGWISSRIRALSPLGEGRSLV